MNTSRRRAAGKTLAALASVVFLAGASASKAQEPVEDASDAGSGAAREQAQSATEATRFVGKRERALAERTLAEPTAVVFWLNSPAGEAASVQAEGERRRMAIRRHVAGAVRPFAEQVAKHSHALIYASAYAPVVIARVDEAALRTLEENNAVAQVYLQRTHRARLDVSRRAVQADVVEARGIDGRGVRIGIVEPGRVGTHAALPLSRRVRCRPGASTTVDFHKTQVAGIMQSADGLYRGMAPVATLIDGIGANFSDAEMIAATDCVIDQGAVAINFSFGSDTNGVFDAFARYVDTIAHVARVTPVVAISNDCSLRMGSPEIAFNALAIGSFSDRGTVALGDDRHSCNPVVFIPHSAFLDPLSPQGDREEPDLVAPGDLITSTIPGGQFEANIGTSFAAPHVTGAVGLLVQRLPALARQPERVRAILMASARHNIEGAARLSERDGAGGLLLAAADRVLLDGQSWSYTKPGGASGFPFVQTFFAQAGEVVRVVLAWSHKMPQGQNATQPTTNLNLVVLGPQSNTVGNAATLDNNWEIVQFTAPITGTYTARVSNARPSPGTEYLGLAVSRKSS